MSLPSGSPSRADAVRHAVPFASLAIVVAFAFWPLFERMAWVSRDFSGHLTLARNLLREAAPDSERFGFELLTVLLAGLSDERADLFWAAVVVSTLATVAKALLSARWLARDLAPWRASALALLVLFLAPITFAAQHPLKDDQSAVHLGQISGLIFHNPTTVLVFPFVLALFVVSWRGRAGSASALAAVQCFIKPSYVVAWLPVVPLLELWRGRRDGRHLGRTAQVVALTLAPAIGVLAWQFFASENLGTMVIAPWRAWHTLSPDIPLSVIRSLAFPFLLVIVHFHEVRRRPEHLVAWAIFGVAFAQYALLYMQGADYPGNWSWGRYLAVYVVFLLGVELYAQMAAQRASWRGWRAVANGALATLLLLHLGSGLFYFWQGVRDGLW